MCSFLFYLNMFVSGLVLLGNVEIRTDQQSSVAMLVTLSLSLSLTQTFSVIMSCRVS